MPSPSNIKHPRFYLSILLIFTTFCIYGENAQAILNSDDAVAYWDILKVILGFYTVSPFVYIIYLRLHSKKNDLYHFKGEYIATDIVNYIEKMEVAFDKKYPNFKTSIKECEINSEDGLYDYSEAINNNLFCIKLNGRKRFRAFWDCSDKYLKIIILSIPIVGIALVVISNLYFGITGLVLSLIALLIAIPIYFTLLSWCLKFFRFLFKVLHLDVPAISASYFSLESIINRNAERAFDSQKGEYFYYSTIHKYNNLVNDEAFQRGHTINANPYTINGILDDYEINKKI